MIKINIIDFYKEDHYIVQKPFYFVKVKDNIKYDNEECIGKILVAYDYDNRMETNDEKIFLLYSIGLNRRQVVILNKETEKYNDVEKIYDKLCLETKPFNWKEYKRDRQYYMSNVI